MCGTCTRKGQISLPADLDPEQVEATYRNGTLLLRLPKAEHARPRQISIKV